MDRLRRLGESLETLAADAARLGQAA